jgi:hypothetical protein
VAGSQTNHIQLKENHFQIASLGFNSNVAAYTVERVIGVEPVRQFLTASTNGRWQVQEVSYDPRSNQWFDVFGNDDRRPGEWGHWTGRGMNWNSMCAECHNTRLRKNYDPATDSYHSTMDEISVSCGACHANLAEHAAWQKSHPNSKQPTAKPDPARMMGACGSCHSLRGNITGNFTPGDSFFDHYDLEIPSDNESWYADGQVHGEDYEFASFLGSKMHERGVTCMDCHNPHTLRPILPGNDLCMRCHSGAFTNAPVIAPLEHTHHLASNAGAQCVGCHMPVTVYMQRDRRRDHAFTIPDPLLTKELNIPNACNRCHADKTVDWAIQHTDEWYGKKMNRPTRDRARWIAAAQRGDKEAQAPLVGMLTNGTQSPYWRAVAAGLLWQWPDDPAVRTALEKSLRDDHPLVREQAARSLEPALDSGDANVTTALQSALSDSVRSVRVAAAWTLRRNLDTNTPAAQDLTAMLNSNADQPVGQYRIAMFSLDRGELAKALLHLKTAESWDPFSPPFHMAAADVLDALGRTNEAERERQTVRSSGFTIPR